MADTEIILWPSAYDGYSTLPLRKNAVHEIRAEDYNRLRNAIVAVEQELGLEPSGSYATVADRLASINDASVQIQAHILDPIDAHDASAISILDTGSNYVSQDVEGALTELASILPPALDSIGNDNANIPNTGIPSFVAKAGTLWVFNNDGANEVKKTQPVNVTGIQIIDIGEENGEGSGVLTQVTFSPLVLNWTAPGDSVGADVDITALAEGEISTLSSGTTSKKIRIVRTDVPITLNNSISDTFTLFRLNAATGAYSSTSEGIVDSDYLTTTSQTGQFMIGGFIFPADKGTLVLQRKLRGSTSFYPIAVLDLTANFDENLRSTNQPVYFSSLADVTKEYDTITLFDRYPAKNDYNTFDANGNLIHENFDISSEFSSFQVAKYLIPASNSQVVGGELESPDDVTGTEVNDKVSTYRLVHYVDGVTDFNGEPDPNEIYSKVDDFGSSNDGDNTVRFSNVFYDDSNTPPIEVGVGQFTFYPVVDAEVNEKIISGIHYYNSDDDVFDLRIASDTNIFKKCYKRDGILTLSSDALKFIDVNGFTDVQPVTQLRDNFDFLYSDANLPDFNDSDKNFGQLVRATGGFDEQARPSPDTNKFSAKTHISATFNSPFQAGVTSDAYGFISGPGNLRILTNSYGNLSTATEEFFVDEAFRVGYTENFDFNLDSEQFTQAYGPNGDLNELQPWEPTLPINTDPNNMDSSQVGGKFGLGGSPDDSADFVFPGLIYPQDDYTTSEIRPLQFGAVDYSATTGPLWYARAFNLGHTINNGKIQIKSAGSSLLAPEDILDGPNQSILIYVKIPGPQGTGWLDAGKLYQTNQYAVNDGCLLNIEGGEGDFTITFTTGEKNNGSTGNMLVIAVNHLDVPAAKQKILTYIKLMDF